MSDKEKYPFLPEQGKNLADFTFEIVKKALQGRFLLVSEDIKDQRMEICRNCDQYDSEQIRCINCGCMLEYKTEFSLDSCPLNKWGESKDAWVNGKFDELLKSIEEDKE